MVAYIFYWSPLSLFYILLYQNSYLVIPHIPEIFK